MDQVSGSLEPAAYVMHRSLIEQKIMAVGGVGITLGIAGLCTLPFIAEPVLSEYLGRGGVVVDHGLINTWAMVSTNLGCALSAIAIAGGMGCLRFRSWARPVMLGFGTVSLLLGLSGIYFHLLILRAAGSDSGMPNFATRVSSLAEWVAWIVGTIFGAWALTTLNRAGVKEVFA